MYLFDVIFLRPVLLLFFSFPLRFIRFTSLSCVDFLSNSSCNTIFDVLDSCLRSKTQ